MNFTFNAGSYYSVLLIVEAIFTGLPSGLVQAKVKVSDCCLLAVFASQSITLKRRTPHTILLRTQHSCPGTIIPRHSEPASTHPLMKIYYQKFDMRSNNMRFSSSKICMLGLSHVIWRYACCDWCKQSLSEYVGGSEKSRRWLFEVVVRSWHLVSASVSLSLSRVDT